MAFHIGTGSWGDDAYVGILYPPGLPRADRLRTYARALGHIEVNSTYYATPAPAAVHAWVQQTPPGFTFSVKLHRAFSQSPVKAAADTTLLPRFLAAMEPLLTARRLSAFLLVLPPGFTPAKRRLEELDALATQLAPTPLAVELRHRDWLTGPQRAATLAHFRSHHLVLVSVDQPPGDNPRILPRSDAVTDPRLAYLRLHGRNPCYATAGSTAEGHHHAYSPRELASIVTRARRLARVATDVFVIANNHANDFAPRAALALRQKLSARPKP
ncbi:DUF72 domain-containing protein [Opitutus sp. ER46]|uniref:DUF72 domain-containing protein n=1 Tax=Opitutus sp. ER46 TaxID=2161864 RepID=UPI000D316932|nr:DUF72 domain-containing protein [Opitutus sp. ER46]PTX96592.1 hypothetical protein DB354_08015 [Opitutus sp. ER46]